MSDGGVRALGVLTAFGSSIRVNVRKQGKKSDWEKICTGINQTKIASKKQQGLSGGVFELIN